MNNNNCGKELSGLKRTSSLIGCVLLLFFCLLYLVIFIVRLLTSNEYFSNIKWLSGILNAIFNKDGMQIFNILLIVIVELFIIYIFNKNFKIDAKRFFKKPKNALSLTLSGILWFISLNVIFSVAVQTLISFLEKVTKTAPTSPNMSAPTTDNLFLFVLYILNACIFAPVVEEIIFRGYILNALKGYGNAFAIVASSVLFGLWHGNFTQAIPLCFASLILGWICLKTNSIIPSIIIHCFNNAIITGFDILSNIINGSYVNFAYNIFIAVVMLIGFSAFILNYKNIKIKPTKTSNISVSKRAVAFILNPGMSVLFIYYIVQYAMLFVK